MRACAPPALSGAARLLRRASPRAPALLCRAAATAGGKSGGTLLRSISADGQLSVTVAVCTELVGGAQALHKTAPTATAALGRALVGGLLLACGKNEGHTCQLTFRGDGELGRLIVVADSASRVKGYVENVNADPPLRPDGKLNVGAAVGRGTLSVLRLQPGLDAPYQGTVELASGEVADDIARFLHDSDQVASAIGLGVSLNRDLSVAAAGGWLVQALPFASDETLTLLERNLTAMPPVTEMVKQYGHDAAQRITDRILEGVGASPGAQVLAPSYGPCVEADLRVRMERSVAALGQAEIRDIVAEQGKLEVTCEFCRMTLQLDADAVLARAA